MTFRPHTGLYGQSWAKISSCGYYATRGEPPQIEALHIPAVFATADVIGVRKTQADAESLCAKHSAKPPTIKAITQLAKGLKQ